MIETVTIEHPDVPGASMIVNKSDFNPTIHKLYEPPAPAPEGKQNTGESDNSNAPHEEGGSNQKSSMPKPKNKPEK